MEADSRTIQERLAQIEEMLWILMPAAYKCGICKTVKATTSREWISSASEYGYTLYFCDVHANEHDGKHRLESC